MYAKCFLTCHSAGRLTGARTTLRSPDVYTCCHCGSTLVLHVESKRPWFAHLDAALTECGRRSCPCIHPGGEDVLLMRQLQRYVPNVRPVVHHTQCTGEYHAYGDEEGICA